MDLSLITAFYRAYAAGEAEAAAALYTEDAFHAEAASGQATPGREAILKGLSGFLSIFDGLHFATEMPIRAGTKVLVLYLMTGTVTRNLGSLPSKGKPVSLRGAHLSELVGDRIASSTDFWDMDDFRAQVAA